MTVTLTQGAVSGQGVGLAECTGALEHYAVTVAAQRSRAFLEGAARVEAEAITRDHGSVVDTQAWTRQVQVVSGQ